MKKRPKRYLAVKDCERCGQSKVAEAFPKVRGGGTADVCAECKRRAVSEAMIAKHAHADELVLKQHEEHFRKTLEQDQARWDSLPDGHPYKAPRRPGSQI